MLKLYFAQADAGGPVKIGVSKEPRKRLATLQTASPEPLVLRRVVEDEDAWGWERRLHELFAPYRMVGEWFQAAPAVANLADAIPSEDFEADVIPLTEDPILFVEIKPPPDISDRFLGRVQNCRWDDRYYDDLRANPDRGYVPAGTFTPPPLTSSHLRLRRLPF